MNVKGQEIVKLLLEQVDVINRLRDENAALRKRLTITDEVVEQARIAALAVFVLGDLRGVRDRDAIVRAALLAAGMEEVRNEY